MHLSDKHKRILRWAGYPALAVVTFLFALHLTFPYERVKDRLFVEPLSDRFDVTVVSVERTFLPGGMILRSVALRTRPTQPDQKPSTLFFDQVRIDLGLWALVRGRADVDVMASLGGGSIKGTLQASKAQIRAAFTTKGLPLGNIPGLQDAVGLPMKGGLNAKIDVTLPEARWDRADGTISLSCPGCVIGDGEARIKPRANPRRRTPTNVAVFAGEGMTVPALNLGDLSGTIAIAGGRGTVENFTAQSPDGELALHAVVRFMPQFKDSRFDSGCMKFKLSDELKAREPSFGNLPEFMSMSPQEDGFSNVSLRGQLATMRWVPTRSCEAGDGGGDRVSRRPAARPTIPARRGGPGDVGDEPPRPRGGSFTDRGDGADEPEVMFETVEPGERVELPDPRTSGPVRSGDEVPPGAPREGVDDAPERRKDRDDVQVIEPRIEEPFIGDMDDPHQDVDDDRDDDDDEDDDDHDDYDR